MSGTRNASAVLKRSAQVFLFVLSVYSVSAPIAFAKTVDPPVDCNTVVCRSDTSITGASAGATVCGQAALDYAPSCNASKCVDSDGHNSYACVYPVTSPTTPVGSTGLCSNADCYAPRQCPSGTGPSSSCGGTCPPPGLSALTQYCVASSTSASGGLSGSQTATGTAGAGILFPENTGLPDPPGGVLQILGNFFGWLMAIFGLLAIGAFVISGIQYLIAAGNDDMIKTAKNNMKWSLVGVIVGLSGWVIMQAIGGALSANPFF